MTAGLVTAQQAAGLITAQQAADRLGVTYEHLAVMRHRQQGPAYVKAGHRVFYEPDVIAGWAAKAAADLRTGGDLTTLKAAAVVLERHGYPATARTVRDAAYDIETETDQ